MKYNIRLCSIILCFAGVIICPAETRTKVFFYPAAYLDQGRLMDGVMVSSLRQVTDVSPDSDLFDGITIMIPWSVLEPEQGKIRYDILDKILEHWHAKGKTVILNVGPAGYMSERGEDWGGAPGKLFGWTPEWVLKKCKTQLYPNGRLLNNTRETAGPTVHPVFWDKGFIDLYSSLIAALGKRYNGDSRFECIRVGTGMMGEDHPLTAKGAENVVAEYTHERWYGYIDQILKAHIAAFPQSRLELDLSWAGHAYSDAAGRKAVDSLLDVMQKNNVILGFNGWSGIPLDEVKTKINSHMGEILKKYRQRGGDVSLETGAPPAANNHFNMQNTAVMLDWCRVLRPVSVNFMGQTPAIVNLAGGTAGVNDGAGVSRYIMSSLSLKEPAETIAKNYRELVIGIRKTVLKND